MIKKLFFLFLFFTIGVGFTQNQISYIKDSNKVYNKETIKNANFSDYNKPINNGFNNGVYWFRVFINSNNNIIQLHNYNIINVEAFKNDVKIFPLKDERYVTFLIDEDAIVYLKVNAHKEALIPVELKSINEFQKDEKMHFLYFGFYYGFAFIVVLINTFYFINFRENTFIYYALFLLSITTGFIISDGFFNFFGISKRLTDIIEVIDHFLVVVFSVFFTYNYLQSENYYKNSRIIGLVLAAIVLFFGLLNIVTNIYIYYVFMEVFVFSTLIYYWLVGVTLFNKNSYTKVLVFAYFFILLLGILFYVTRLFGIPAIINSSKLKLGGFIEMIVLSFAVIYRMKILQEENTNMRDEIVKFSKKIKKLSKKLEKISKEPIDIIAQANLSIREIEILKFISDGKTNKEIASQLNISVNTVKYHVKNIYEKLNIKSRKEALVIVNA